MKIIELYRDFDEAFPITLRMDWDNDGLMCCPDPDHEIRRALVTLDVTEEAVDYAIANGFDLIVSHHPMVFRAQKAVTLDAPVQRKLIKLIKENISVASFHTRLDASAGGVNDALAARLGFENAMPLPDGGTGLGRLITLPHPVHIADFAALVKEKLGAPAVLYSGERPVSVVALVGGEGADFISAAIRAGADTFLAGRLGYHNMVDAPENRINLVECGHFFSEFPVCDVLAARLREKVPGAYVEVYTSNRIRAI